MDRIHDAYYGKLGKNIQLKTIRRVDWILSKIYDDEVLDIGCSQGVVPFKLARLGKNVVAIDIEKDAIDWCNNELKITNDELVGRLTFREMDYANLTYEDTFDTVIATEIIEHLEFPDQLVIKSWECLKMNGRFVLTYPLGYSPHEDHYKSYYLTAIIALLADYFKNIEISYLDKWVCITCSKKEYMSGERYKLTMNDIEELENHLLEKEMDLYTRYTNFKSHSIKYKKAYSVEKEKKLGLVNKVSAISNENEALKDELKKIEKNLELQRELDKYRDKCKAYYNSRPYQIGRIITRGLKPSIYTLRLPYDLIRYLVSTRQK